MIVLDARYCKAYRERLQKSASSCAGGVSQLHLDAARHQRIGLALPKQGLRLRWSLDFTYASLARNNCRAEQYEGCGKCAKCAKSCRWRSPRRLHPVSALSALCAGRSPNSSPLTLNLWIERPPVLIVTLLSHPAFAKRSSSSCVYSASSFCPRASRRISSREISSLPCALIHRRTRRAFRWRSLNPICRKAARACGQKNPCQSRIAAVMNCSLIDLGSKDPVMPSTPCDEDVPNETAHAMNANVPASRSTMASPFANNWSSWPSSARFVLSASRRNSSNFAIARSDSHTSCGANLPSTNSAGKLFKLSSAFWSSDSTWAASLVSGRYSGVAGHAYRNRLAMPSSSPQNARASLSG
jgi:hypothetical protein